MMLKPHSIYFVNSAVDMRYGMTWLTSFVHTHFKGIWQDGTAFIFMNRRRNVIKLLQFDSHGVWLCQRKLHQGCFPNLKQGESYLVLSTSHIWTSSNWQEKNEIFNKIRMLPYIRLLCRLFEPEHRMKFAHEVLSI